MVELKGALAVVTGAGSGVGACVARGLAARGMIVVAVGRREDKLQETVDSIRSKGGEAAVHSCDVSCPESVVALRTSVLDRFGTPMVLFNGAGVHCEMVPIGESTPEEWLKTLMINTGGPYLMCRAFMGSMVEQGWGRILNVSSAASIGAPGGVGSVYQLSKVALNHFTRQLAAELDGTGVTANAIHPGEVKTEMWEHIKNDSARRGASGEGGRNWSKMVEESGGDPPEKTAELVWSLLTREKDGINGEFLWIRDGIQQARKAW